MNSLRMRRTAGAVIFLSIVGFGSQTAWSADGDLKAALQSRYAAMKSAMADHNGAAIAAILAPDFASIDVTGQSETAAQMIDEVNALKPDPNKLSETTLLSISSAANSVTVKQRYDMKTTKIASDGSRHSVELITLSTDSWTKSAGEWLLQRTVTNEISYYKDGQMVMHKQSA
jgi:hypothetical protein